MRTHMEPFAAWLTAFSAMALACGGTIEPQDGRGQGLDQAGAWSGQANAYYTVGGAISGLSGTVVLQDNGADDLGQSGEGPFTFATALKNRSTYAATVRAQPSGQTCSVANGTGTIAGANVTQVAVSCSACTSKVATPTVDPAPGTYSSSLSVTLSTYTPGATIHYTLCDPDDTSCINGDPAAWTTYTDPILIDHTTTIEAIAMENGFCNSDVGGGFYYREYTLGGTISGLSGTAILQDEGGENLVLSANGSFRLATPLADGSSYSVTVAQQPTYQHCSVANGAGTIERADVTNLSVSCSPSSAQVAAPTLSPVPDTYYLCHPWFVESVSVKVIMSDVTQGAAIYYTTDGTSPTIASTPYAGPITVASTTPIKAVAIANGLSSEVTGGTYTIQQANTYGTTADPTFSPDTGAYDSAQSVAISDVTAGATIYYAIVDDTVAAYGGSIATPFTVYTGPIAVDRTSTVEAYASLSGGLCSPGFMAAWFTISQAAPPWLDFPPGSYGSCDGTLQLSLNDITPNAVMYYTTDGTTPTAGSTRYTYGVPITISDTAAITTVKAFAVESGLSDSNVTSGDYSVYLDPSVCGAGWF